MTVLSRDGAGERTAGALPDDLVLRVHALRRARRDARTRAFRVRRVLLAPTAGGEPYPQAPDRHRA